MWCCWSRILLIGVWFIVIMLFVLVFLFFGCCGVCCSICYDVVVFGLVFFVGVVGGGVCLVV